jgi:hypothetical protein
MTRTRFHLLLAAAMPLAAALAACEGGGTIATEPGAGGDTLKTPPAGPVPPTAPVPPPRFDSGSYTLARVAGKPLPAFYYDDGTTRGDYTGGTLRLNPDGSFASDYTIHYSRVRNGTPHDWQIRLTGQYEARGESIRYRVSEVSGGVPRPGGDLLGVIGADTVTILTHATETAVYVRRP